MTKITSRVVLVVASATLALPAAAQMYRCTEGGQTTYQQVPCEGGRRVNSSGAGEADLASPGAVQARREVLALRRRQTVEQAILSGSIVVGMTADEVVRSWGQPSKVNKTVTASRVSEQWVYRRGPVESQYVYLDNGVVTTIQSPQ